MTCVTRERPAIAADTRRVPALTRTGSASGLFPTATSSTNSSAPSRLQVMAMFAMRAAIVVDAVLEVASAGIDVAAGLSDVLG